MKAGRCLRPDRVNVAGPTSLAWPLSSSSTAMPDLPTLVPGHIGMGTTIAGYVVRIRPTADSDRWHVSSSRGPDATAEPVRAADIPALLEAWQVDPMTWSSWAAPIHE